MQSIKVKCQKNLNALKIAIEDAFPRECNFNDNLCVYACGSLGRLEMVEPSDLDLFFISMPDESDDSPFFSNIDRYIFFAKLYEINKKLGYQEPSKRGEYWDFISKKNLLDIGSRQEDFNNSFTARMLLLLESKPVYNILAYEKLITDTISKYFTDYEDNKENFHPLFLMNDILRYWYTLTMNYEYRRDYKDSESKKNWKRLKLKYARLVTCYSMLACLYKTNITPEYVHECIKITPFERLAKLSLINSNIENIVQEINEEYKWFLGLKSESHDWWDKDSNKSIALNHANRFHKMVVHSLMKTVSEGNPALRNKADVY